MDKMVKDNRNNHIETSLYVNAQMVTVKNKESLNP
jgi:hypothetical protein